MSHEIETFADGTAAFVCAREDAWHRLGVVTRDCLTAEQVMTTARLGGWNVRTVPLSATDLTDDGVTTLAVSDHYATVRTHPVTGRPDVLGVVGSGYTVVQNEEHCELLNLLVDEAGAHFETAGSLRGGRETFVTMKLPHTLTLDTGHGARAARGAPTGPDRCSWPRPPTISRWSWRTARSRTRPAKSVVSQHFSPICRLSGGTWDRR